MVRTRRANHERVIPPGSFSCGQEVESHYQRHLSWRIVSADGDGGRRSWRETFDIRFARSAGLAGLFEAPANEFRWKGAGQLSIDASGISIAVKRGLLTLFARATHRAASPTNSLIEVYREGNALRLEFSTQDSPRTVLPVWVSDRDAAAQIVTLLPTERSVELEDVAPASTAQISDRSTTGCRAADRSRDTWNGRSGAAAVLRGGSRRTAGRSHTTANVARGEFRHRAARIGHADGCWTPYTGFQNARCARRARKSRTSVRRTDSSTGAVDEYAFGIRGGRVPDGRI